MATLARKCGELMPVSSNSGVQKTHSWSSDPGMKHLDASGVQIPRLVRGCLLCPWRCRTMAYGHSALARDGHLTSTSAPFNICDLHTKCIPKVRTCQLLTAPFCKQLSANKKPARCFIFFNTAVVEQYSWTAGRG